MRLFSIDRFAARQGGQIPTPPQGQSGWRAVGIHPSSEVEDCDIGGIRLGVKGILPFPGAEVKANRVSINSAAGPLSADVVTAADGNFFPGEKLVLQLYEECDDLAPPGARASYKTRAFISALPTTAIAAKCVAVLPMSQRTRAALYWTGIDATCTIQLMGVRMNFGVAKGYTPIPNATAYNTPAIVPAFSGLNGANVFSRALYIDNESFDFLIVYAWDSTGASLDFVGEAIGERL